MYLWRGYKLVSIHLTVGFIADSLVRFEKHYGSGLMVIAENFTVRFCNLLIVYYFKFKIMTKENKFLKILIACGVTIDMLRDYEWDVVEIEQHKYHCIGVHPVAKRIDIIKDKIVIH